MKFNMFSRFFATVVIFSAISIEAHAAPDEKTKEIEKAYVDSVKYGGNVTYSKLKLLEHKYPDAAKASRGRSDYLYSYRTPITIRSENSSGFSYSLPFETGSEIDILTGKRAIDESLQLNSIDSTPPAWRRNVPPTNDKIADLSASKITSLTIKSHPWDEMLKGREVPEISPLFALVPKDHFVVYFKELQEFSNLEKALKALSASSSYYMASENQVDVKDKIKERLGLKNISALEALVSEIGMVSEDFDFYPNTHYALILGFKSSLVQDISAYLSPSKSFSKKVGNYLVISTSQALLDRINDSLEHPANSMKEAKDFVYCMSALDKRRDGVAYLSESFILKLVSAPYRINSGRRASALTKLEAYQYTIFAYRSITDNWPKSFEQMAEEGYIEKGSVSPEYTIDSDGIVRNSIWGTLYDVKAVSDVAIDNVTISEKQRYDSFREGYQNFWREYFDPVGVGITVGDQIRFHTIILPLINNSEYNLFKLIAGNGPATFSSLASSRRLPAIMFMSKFNLDDFILEEYPKNEFRFMSKYPNFDKLSRTELAKAINEDFQKDLGLEEQIEVFDMVGDEFVVGVEGNQSFAVSNIADVDVFVGVKLKDKDKFKKFINSIYKVAFKSFSRNGGMASPFFSLSSTEPLKNEYKSHEFFLIPIGFTNIYYVYIDDFVYFTVSQLSINRLIDSKEHQTGLSSQQNRAIDYIGSENNAMFLVDGEAASKGREHLATQLSSDYYLSSRAHDWAGYLSDVDLLLKTFGNETEKINKYFPVIPKKVVGVPVKIEGQKVLFGKDANLEYKNINFGSYSRYYVGQTSWENEYKDSATPVEFGTLIDKNLSKDILSQLTTIKNMGVAVKFTPEGLDTKVTFNNPLKTDSDARFPKTAVETAATSGGLSIPGVSANSNLHVILAVVGGVGAIVLCKFLIKKTK